MHLIRVLFYRYKYNENCFFAENVSEPYCTSKVCVCSYNRVGDIWVTSFGLIVICISLLIDSSGEKLRWAEVHRNSWESSFGLMLF